MRAQSKVYNICRHRTFYRAKIIEKQEKNIYIYTYIYI